MERIYIVREMLQNVSDLLKIGEGIKAYQKLERGMTDLQQVITFLISNQIVDQKQLLLVLENMVSAMENQDDVLLMDCVEYQLIPLFCELIDLTSEDKMYEE